MECFLIVISERSEGPVSGAQLRPWESRDSGSDASHRLGM